VVAWAATTDEKLGFKNVAKYCYTPGRQEGGTLLHVIASLEKWEGLPPADKKAVEQRGFCENLRCAEGF